MPRRAWKKILFVLSILAWIVPLASLAADPAKPVSGAGGYVRVIEMKMMILPGTASFLSEQIAEASRDGAKVLVIKFDTPGGILDTSQQMIQEIFRSPVPVVIYVSPTGGTATSAGVFITMAAHVAAMAPGTSIGAAHPVMGDGKDIEGDMRKKAENMTVALVKSIADRRGRNVSWAEKAVKESNSLTEKEAVKQGVVDFVAEDMDDLLRKLKGREVKLEGSNVTLEDYSQLPRQYYEMSLKDRAINVLANPNVAALLWLAATTGISLELYNPGVVLPGVVGVICLILALAVSQIIPINTGAVLLIVVGAGLIGAELYTGSLVLGVGGIISMILGSLYLVNVSEAPGMSVALEFIMPVAAFFGGLLFLVALRATRVIRSRSTTGSEGMVGELGEAVENVALSGRVFVKGEYWNACSEEGIIEKGSKIQVLSRKQGLTLIVKKIT